MPTDVRKPITVKVTIVLFGLLAFLSWVALVRSEPGTIHTLVALLRTIPATLAFIGVLSNTKFGRAVAVAVLFLLCISGVLGLLAALKSFSSTPVLAVAAAAIAVGIFVWAALYTFGTSTRAYYSAIFALKQTSPTAE